MDRIECERMDCSQEGVLHKYTTTLTLLYVNEVGLYIGTVT